MVQILFLFIVPFGGFSQVRKKLFESLQKLVRRNVVTGQSSLLVPVDVDKQDGRRLHHGVLGVQRVGRLCSEDLYDASSTVGRGVEDDAAAHVVARRRLVALPLEDEGLDDC